MSGRAPIRVLVAEDDPVVRDALEALFQSEPSLELAAAVGDATSAVEAATRERPAVALIDVCMPGGGANATRGIKVSAPGTRVLAFTAHDDRETVLEMLEAGAVGYLVKGDSIDDIVEAIHQAADGQAPLSVEVTGDIIEELVGQLGINRRAETQTRRSEKRIRRALDEDDVLSMVFQPICTLDGVTVGAEALARFRGPPKRGPEEWFTEADEVGLGAQLELAAAGAALSALSKLPANVYLSVNVSPTTVMRADFRKLLKDSDRGRIVVEVTEHAPIDDYERMNGALNHLRSLGVRLAIDDAGAGFASLRHIVRLAPEFIKLDRTLVNGIEKDRSRQALAAGLISFADKMDATIIAEGIERSAEVDALMALGVGYGQGFLIARPAPLPLKTTGFQAGRRRAAAAGQRRATSIAFREVPPTTV
jgi:EAL domain-containing protein (putative c-di-GMP-specific phosphodiesterase class I)/DNA-binding NarL/FixJ family response regulator